MESERVGAGVRRVSGEGAGAVPDCPRGRGHRQRPAEFLALPLAPTSLPVLCHSAPFGDLLMDMVLKAP